MDEWNVVSRKKGAGRRMAAPYVNSSSAHHPRKESPQVPSEVLVKGVFEEVGIVDNEEEEEKLLWRMRRAVVKVKESSFFSNFLKQMIDLKVTENLLRSGDQRLTGGNLGSEASEILRMQRGMEDMSIVDEVERKDACKESPTVELVLYGVGSIYTAEIARCQLALALLMKQNSSSIGEILVYDPIMTPIECRVLRTLGCVPLETNNNGKRPISGPTLFYMPHNEVELYDTLVETNLEPFNLKKIVILGNSFRKYSERWTMHPLPDGEVPYYLLKVQKLVQEIPVADGFYPSAFNDTSWHFFFDLEASQLS